MTKHAIFVLILAVFFAACGSETDESQTISPEQQTIDSLQQVVDNQNETINNFFESFNSIQENLDLIKEKENIISVTSKDPEVQADAKDRINEDIVLIYELMQENKRELENMKASLRQSNLKITEFERMVANLTEEIEVRDEQIAELRQDLENKNIHIEDLTENLDSLAAESEMKSEVIEEQISELNTAFYIYGTRKELEEKEVITRTGGFIGIGRMNTLMEDFSTEDFKKIDITQTTSIPVFSEEIDIVTTHPSSAYNLAKDGETIDSLVITKPDDFWSVSKYLVIVIEK